MDIESHEDPMRGGLRSRPLDVQILTHDWLHFDGFIGAFERGQVHFAIALQARFGVVGQFEFSDS
jgi:hypothetical protein